MSGRFFICQCPQCLNDAAAIRKAIADVGTAGEATKADGIAGRSVFQKTPQPLTIPAGAQIRLDAQVKKLERQFKIVVDGLASAYDVFKVPYTLYAWGVDVYSNEDNAVGVTSKQCDDLIARFVDEFEGLARAAQTTGDASDPRFVQIVWRMRPKFSLMLGDHGNGRLKLTTRLHF